MKFRTIAIPAGLFLFSSGLSSVFVFYAKPAIYGNAVELMRLGCSLATGGGYTALSGDPTAYMPPGYPAFLALVSLVRGCYDPLAVGTAQSVLQGFTTICIYYVCRHFLSERWALGFALTCGIIPIHATRPANIVDTTLFSALVALSVWLALALAKTPSRWITIVVLGLVGGGVCSSRRPSSSFR